MITTLPSYAERNKDKSIPASSSQVYLGRCNGICLCHTLWVNSEQKDKARIQKQLINAQVVLAPEEM